MFLRELPTKEPGHRAVHQITNQRITVILCIIQSKSLLERQLLFPP